jgi:hypothetical protein
MNDEEIIELLKLTINCENPDELTDEMVDSIISRTKECPSERTERIRKRYIEKLFEELNPIPLQKIDTKSTFGRWVEGFRSKVQVSIADIGAALNQDPIFIEKIERSEIFPWECPPEFIADLMKLFRVHINGVAQLIATSNAVNQTHGVGQVAARSRGGKVSKERGESTARALDMFLAHNAAPAKTQDAVIEWMEKLRGTLKERKMDYLIDSDEEINRK